jgi:enoyl-CoA hydratase/carnithine racemase
MSETLQIVRDGRLLRIALNRLEKRNALNAALCYDLTAALGEAQADAGVGAILLTGNGASFSAGMDLDEVLTPAGAALADVHERLFTAFAWMEKPLIAAVQGNALAGGTGLAANAHIVIAADDARFGLTEIRIGLWPFLIFRAVVAAVGERRAVELSLSGRIFGAAEGQAYGLVHQVVPAADLEARARELAGAIAGSSPLAIESGLGFVQETRNLNLADAGRVARDFRRQIFESEDFQQRVRAFRTKRPLPGR